MEAIILAGGLGTRIRSTLGAHTPKVLAPVRGRPFLHYQLDYWTGQGVKRFIVATGHLAEKIQQAFSSGYPKAKIEFSTESSPLGTGGALLKAVAKLGPSQESPVLVMNGDTFLNISLRSWVDFHQQKQAGLSLALSRVKQNNRFGCVELDNQNRVLGLDCRYKAEDALLVNAGHYLFSRKMLNRFSWHCEGCSLESELIPQLLRWREPVFGFTEGGTFLDIGVPEDYRRADHFLSINH